MVRRSSFDETSPVTYGAIGGTLAPDLLTFPPAGFKPARYEARLGSGTERFEIAAASLMTWGVQRGSGITVADITPAIGGTPYTGVNFDRNGEPVDLTSRETEDLFAPDGTAYIGAGMTAVLKIRVGVIEAEAPVRVVYVVDEPDQIGYAYGTLEGHPESGEESFVVEHRDDDSVWIVIRVFSRPSSLKYRLVAPFLRFQQSRITKKYLRALLPARVS